MKKKILVLAYAISPTRGSEYSVAWNYVLNMSKDNELVVLYGTSGNYIGDTLELKHYLTTNPIKNIRFVDVEPTKAVNLLNSLNKRNIFVYSFYFAYNLWHKQVYHKAKELVSKEHFDLIHYVVPIGYREPGYLWKLKLPYIWGPIGGTTNVSGKLLKALPFSGKLKLGFRAVVNYIQLRINLRLKKALKRANVLITATTNDKTIFNRVYGIDSYYLPENGIVSLGQTTTNLRKDYNTLNLIWIGRIDANKALIILLEAITKIENRTKIKVHIVGDGILKNSLMRFAEINSISSNIIWYGSVKREKVFNLLSQSQVHIITSVTEANTTVIWEAMSAGVPTISLDHCGMHDTICDKCGIKIPIQSYEQVINDLAFQIDRLVTNPQEIEKLSVGVNECAKKYTWDLRREFFNNMYELAIENWEIRKSVSNETFN